LLFLLYLLIKRLFLPVFNATQGSGDESFK
jgi:hypothetical protein